jgi:hypothetical protein
MPSKPHEIGGEGMELTNELKGVLIETAAPLTTLFFGLEGPSGRPFQAAITACDRSCCARPCAVTRPRRSENADVGG